MLCLSKRFFLLFLQHRKIAKAKKQAFLFEQVPKNILAARAVDTSLYTLKIVAILLVNARKALKFYRFESVQSLVSFLI